MTDLYHPGHEASIPQMIEIHGYTVQLQQTALEWMAVMTPPRERPSIVLAVDQEIVLANTAIAGTVLLRRRQAQDAAP